MQTNTSSKNQSEKQKIFSIFLKNLDFAFSQFVIWKNLKNKEFNFIFKKNTYVWTTLMRSLFLGFSTELAKLIERQNPIRDEVISIFYLLGFELENYKETLEKIRKLRNKVLMHNDLGALTNLGVFMKKLNLKYGDIEDIFQKLICILDEVKSDFQNATDCKAYFSKLESLCTNDLKKFMILLSSE